jgi:hypothetical protein
VQNLLSEIEARREEIRELKRCQLQYFIMSVGGTGALIGLLEALATPGTGAAAPISGLYFLAPLAIVLPCWLVFFDKATTITRIAGYCKWIEGELRYKGNETALEMFRDFEDHRPKARARLWGRLGDLLFLRRVRHRYWLINWCTFLLLVCLCFFVAVARGAGNHWAADFETVGLIVGTAMSLYCAAYTAVVLADLLWGPHSYRRVAQTWRTVLNSTASGE